MTTSPYVLLCERLAGLAAETGASHVSVLDENGHMYGFSEPPSPEELSTIGTLMDELLASADQPLKRGGHVHFVRTKPPCALAQSFAGVYVLLLTFDDPPPPAARLVLQRSLHDIEAITTMLPPDDPGAGEGMMRARRSPR